MITVERVSQILRDHHPHQTDIVPDYWAEACAFMDALGEDNFLDVGGIENLLAFVLFSGAEFEDADCEAPARDIYDAMNEVH